MKCEYIKQQLREINRVSPALAKKIDQQFGCLSSKDVEELILIDPFWQILIRCGNGRFVTAAQSVEWFSKVVAQGGDYVRDYSLVVDDWSHFSKTKK